MQDLTKMDPPEIEALWQEALKPAQRTEMDLNGCLSQQRRYRKFGAEIPEYLTEREEYLREQLNEQLAQVSATFQTEFDRRGGWTRYYHVQGGHVHKLSCQTLTPGRTLVGLVIEASGMDADDVIGRFDYTACTHCFPSAPVAREKAPEEEGYCKHSGQYISQEQRDKLTARWGSWHNLAVAPSVKCECGGHPSITKTDKIRKHKPGKPQL
jgi:hypothetical protein